MEYLNIEDLILDLADLVYEVRKLRKENIELLDYKQRQEEFISSQVQINMENVVKTLEVLSQ